MNNAIHMQRFHIFIDITPGHGPYGYCWLWLGYIAPNGYGRFSVKDYSPTSNSAYAHRFSYEQYVDAIPNNFTIDHLCRVRHCVNPVHLEPVTYRENIMRGEGRASHNAKMVYCEKGHLLDGYNNYHSTAAIGKRCCRICHNERSKLRLRRLRGIS